MRNTSFTITVPTLFSPLSAFRAESRLYIITLRFNLHETLQYFKLSRMLIVLLLFFPLFSISASGNDEMKNTSFVIRVDDNLLTARVKDISLEKVLTEVADQMSMKIIYLVPGEEPVVADFSRLPVEKGLRQLLRDYNYAFARDSKDAENGKPHIRKVFILSRKSNPIVLPAKFTLGFTPRFAGETSLEILRNALKDKDPYIREDAVDAIRALKDEGNIELLKGVLLTDRNEYVRESAAGALGFTRSEKAINPLKEALKDESVDVRISVADALGLINSDDAVEPLMVALKDEDREVRESAINSLAWVGGERANMAYEKALAGEEERQRVEGKETTEKFKNKY
jgi:hypothetical protein